MRIFITGQHGQLGTALTTYLNGQHDIVSLTHNRVDITDNKAVFSAVEATEPELLIHCAAYTDVNGCALHPARAYRVNGYGTQNVALACLKYDVELVHISTNEVFAGDRLSGYEEWMPLNPVNPYGRSKAAAEVHVRTLLNRYYIVRPAWLYAPHGHNFIHAILKRAREKGEIQVVTDEVGNPTNVSDLARAIIRLITTRQYGTYHFVNEGACSRWEFANHILSTAGLPHVRNMPILSKEFKRPSSPPHYTALHNMAGAALGISFRPWQDALAEFIQTLHTDEKNESTPTNSAG